jgi:hypothetical protein
MVRKLFQLAVLGVALLCGAQSGKGAQATANQSEISPDSKIDSAVQERIRREGTVRVIASLNVPGWTSKPATQQADLISDK